MAWPYSRASSLQQQPSGPVSLLWSGFAGLGLKSRRPTFIHSLAECSFPFIGSAQASVSTVLVLHFEYVRSATSGRYKSPSHIDNMKTAQDRWYFEESTALAKSSGMPRMSALLRAEQPVLADDAKLTPDEDLIT
ncbi:hypothetical protein TRIATDRAFT_93477 [Trichoderma atroviride IMI 206040]|uniref:Uncharacterized protein n=1 Tax=Hypocrea atroviridis (strain ATCC 20476 / IMI 206040) TaxID=452589 RepID=G9NFB4_HYPAI|nr:uncharacterized protein TRIATDRAFT_93477 [Trichoderma atroviride IMI 206040]EHK50630.1 hypothetical protein TRIATDRAFT_93477 [Trichoderma atroviride IMI 206040]